MRCEHTGRHLPAIWKHPDLDSQLIAALTRNDAYLLTKLITGKNLDHTSFSRTGKFATEERVFSVGTDDILSSEQKLITENEYRNILKKYYP